MPLLSRFRDEAHIVKRFLLDVRKLDTRITFIRRGVEFDVIITERLIRHTRFWREWGAMISEIELIARRSGAEGVHYVHQDHWREAADILLPTIEDALVELAPESRPFFETLDNYLDFPTWTLSLTRNVFERGNVCPKVLGGLDTTQTAFHIRPPPNSRLAWLHPTLARHTDVSVPLYEAHSARAPRSVTTPDGDLFATQLCHALKLSNGDVSWASLAAFNTILTLYSSCVNLGLSWPTCLQKPVGVAELAMTSSWRDQDHSIVALLLQPIQLQRSLADIIESITVYREDGAFWDTFEEFEEWRREQRARHLTTVLPLWREKTKAGVTELHSRGVMCGSKQRSYISAYTVTTGMEDDIRILNSTIRSLAECDSPEEAERCKQADHEAVDRLFSKWMVNELFFDE